MATPLSIEAYKRKQNVLAAKAQKRRVSTSCNHTNSRSKESYTPDQRRYLDACVEKQANPDPRLLAALREARFVLKLDRFGEEELFFNMGFLRKAKTCSHISLSLGSVTINRDLRAKFDRLGLKRAYAYENEGAAVVVRSACASANKAPSLVRFHLIGVKISPEVVPLLSKRSVTRFTTTSGCSVSLLGTTLSNTSLTIGCLGLNLGGNHLSQQGTELFIDTLSKRNQTLAVLALANMKNPEKRKMQEYVNKVESYIEQAENRQLRVELDARTKSIPASGISPIEAQIIAQLETSISSLAEQVEFMEHEKLQQPPSS
ncbi:hypothetical protein JG688_00007474 [Phytophthora aleatoria]|uniref:Uncharacterized protein n=1 Tax=Phytophthora aleatoria TaxID=2496075 RepID=A0A8J5IKZ9_9STRA|nr:hypothetical protein JG688_00007474 [Phytophthora aleatoria]